MHNVIIIGGGIGGLCTAIALQKVGIHVKVFEASSEIRTAGAGLGLGANAVKCLKELGIEEAVLSRGKTLKSFSVLDDKGKLIFLANSEKINKKYDANNFSIHRKELHTALQELINPGTIFKSKKLVDFVQHADKVTAFFEDGSSCSADGLVGADGIHSRIRKKLIPSAYYRYSGYTCWRAVVEWHPSFGPIESSSETWGVKGRFGIVPLAKNLIYWYACINAPAQDAQMKKFTVKDLQKVFAEYHDPVPKILSYTSDENMIWNDIFDVGPLKCFAFDRIVLLGDAAHATTPNLGQGACMAIEDAIFLSKACIYNEEVQDAFKEFEEKRIRRTTKIINSSRLMGTIAQLDNPVLCRIRNLLLKMGSGLARDRQLEFLYNVDFEPPSL